MRLSLAVLPFTLFSGCTCSEPPEAAVPVHTVMDSVVPLADATAMPSHDLDGIRQAGSLRVLVRASDLEALPREEGTARSRAHELAVSLGLDEQLVVVPDEGDLLTALAGGFGDVAAAEGAELPPELVGARGAEWVVRQASPDLLEALNGLLIEISLTSHRRQRYPARLAEIKKRGVLRVGMLNNSVSYFVYRGQEVGFQYELAALLASRLAVRLEVVVPDRPADMLRLLREGRVDLAAVVLDERRRQTDLVYSSSFSNARHLLVQRAGEPPIVSAAELDGRRVHVRPSSAYMETLAGVSGVKIAPASEELETENLIAMVGEGTIELTVANSVLLGVELSFRDDVQGTLVLARDRRLVYAMPKEASALLERINFLVEREVQGEAYQQIVAKYFDNQERMAELRADQVAQSGTISPYDDLVRKYARQYNIDWRLVLAQMYQESRFDPRAKSWAGAIGLMQVMPRTGEEMGFRDLYDPDQNVHAGVKYLARLLERTEEDLPMRQRVRFALAGYNAGMGHVRDARSLARRMKLDPNRWFGNVEKTMLLLEKESYHRQAPSGYCRGSEPVAYVSRIQSKYDGFVSLVPVAEAERPTVGK